MLAVLMSVATSSDVFCSRHRGAPPRCIPGSTWRRARRGRTARRRTTTAATTGRATTRRPRSMSPHRGRCAGLPVQTAEQPARWAQVRSCRKALGSWDAALKATCGLTVPRIPCSAPYMCAFSRSHNAPCAGGLESCGAAGSGRRGVRGDFRPYGGRGVLLLQGTPLGHTPSCCVTACHVTVWQDSAPSLSVLCLFN